MGPPEGFVYLGRERRHRVVPDDLHVVVLRRKLAEMIDGINLAGRQAGDRLLLSARDASLLIAEGWAELPLAKHQRRRRG